MTKIRVLGYILPDKPDNSSKAFFANFSRAEQYAKMLLNSGDYTHVTILDTTTMEQAVINREN